MSSLVFAVCFILPLRFSWFSFLSDLDFLSDQMCQKLMWDVCCFLPLPTFFHPLVLLIMSSQIRTSSQARSFKSRFGMFWQFFASIKDFSSIGYQWFPLRPRLPLWPGCWCDMLAIFCFFVFSFFCLFVRFLSSKVTFIYIAFLTVWIVSKQFYSDNRY